MGTTNTEETKMETTIEQLKAMTYKNPAGWDYGVCPTCPVDERGYGSQTVNGTCVRCGVTR